MNAAETRTVLINTVEENKSKYFSYDYAHAVLSHKLQKIVERPRIKSFCTFVNNLLNRSIDRNDILAAESVFCLDVVFLREKTV